MTVFRIFATAMALPAANGLRLSAAVLHRPVAPPHDHGIRVPEDHQPKATAKSVAVLKVDNEREVPVAEVVGAIATSCSSPNSPADFHVAGGREHLKTISGRATLIELMDRCEQFIKESAGEGAVQGHVRNAQRAEELLSWEDDRELWSAQQVKEKQEMSSPKVAIWILSQEDAIKRLRQGLSWASTAIENERRAFTFVDGMISSKIAFDAEDIGKIFDHASQWFGLAAEWLGTVKEALADPKSKLGRSKKSFLEPNSFGEDELKALVVRLQERVDDASTNAKRYRRAKRV